MLLRKSKNKNHEKIIIIIFTGLFLPSSPSYTATCKRKRFSRLKTTPVILMTFVLLLLVTSCTVIRPGEVGVKQRLGKLSDNITTQGTEENVFQVKWVIFFK